MVTCAPLAAILTNAPGWMGWSALSSLSCRRGY
jgi:hypothetical protein